MKGSKMRMTILALIIGFCIDFILGDPVWLYHPVRIIGNIITSLETVIRKRCGKNLRQGGLLLVILVVFFSTMIPFVILKAGYFLHPALGLLLESIMCYQLLAAKSLKSESMKVYWALKSGKLENARYAVSMIVGRDTKNLDSIEITKAAVETIAENTSDGVIAPLIFMAVGGAPLGFLYKSINTMDSMIGYKNERYLDFGRCAAKLDDIVNYFPARISAFLMLGASVLLRLDARNGWRIFRRDRYNHASPNSAQTESAAAGVLGIQLAGDAYYFGKKVEKPAIGDSLREIEIEDIKRTNLLMYSAAVLGMLIILLIYACMGIIF
jgi:adenosylcobinamide-phosphate synthase